MPAHPQPRRLSGRSVVLVLLALIAGTVGWALYRWYSTLWPTGAIRSVRAIDDDRALVIREGDGSQFPLYLTLVDREDGVQWATGLYGVQADVEGNPGLLRDNDGAPTTATVRAEDADGTMETHAFSLTEGKFLWRGGTVGDAPAGGQTLAVGETVYELYADRTLLALSADGDERFRAPLPEANGTPQRARLTAHGTRILVEAAGHTHEVDARGGVHRLSPRGSDQSCASGSAQVSVKAGTLWLQHERRPLMNLLIPADAIFLCGVLGETTVIGSTAPDGAHLHGVKAASTWSLPLGPASPVLHALRSRGAIGELPRRLPVLMTGRGDAPSSAAVEVHVVDLETGAVAERFRLDARAADARWLDGYGAPHSMLAIGDGQVARFDPLSGRPVAMARVRGSDAAFGPWLLSERHLWVTDGHSVRPLQLGTLRPAIGLAKAPLVTELPIAPQISPVAAPSRAVD